MVRVSFDKFTLSMMFLIRIITNNNAKMTKTKHHKTNVAVNSDFVFI